MMNRYEKLLNEWCLYLLKMQRDDGGFNCEADDMIHGRADNAVFPFIYEYAHTGDVRFLIGAKKLMQFRKNFEHDDGAVQNDYTSQWKGITVFSAINLYKTLINFGDFLPKDFRQEIENCFAKSAQWVHENVREGFRANINYYAAASTVNAMYGKYSGEKNYSNHAKNLLDYCMKNFTENGLLTGEGQPHNFRTEKGCAPVDIGYNIEESLPCLIDTAIILNDEENLKRLSEHAEKLLDFMLPDGGWDNSFGARNNKWTYYGSRTSDGCIAAFTELGKINPIFNEAAERTYEILRRCTVNGKLYGGMHYKENNQPACVHHTFSHAVALADALCTGLRSDSEKKPLPCDRDGFGYTYYPEIDTYKIRTGKWIATVTGYDFSTYTYTRGAAHSSGGTLSLLYNKNCGPVIAGTVYNYQLTEQNNMQQPANGVKHATLIPRAEYEKNGIKYATCLDGDAEIFVTENEKNISVKVKSRFVCVEEKCAENENIFAEFLYEFSDEKVEISVSVSEENSDIKFVLPIIENSAKIETKNPYKKEKIFFLTGGFSADEFKFNLDSNLNITIKAK